MTPRRSIWHIVVPAALAALVVALAVLQYRWLGQVSEAERRQLRESLDQRAEAFAGEFDREIGALYMHFAAVRGTTDAEFSASLQEASASWRKPPRSRLLQHVHWVSLDAPDDLFSLRDRIYQRGPWPLALEAVRNRLHVDRRSSSTDTTDRLTELVSLGGSPLVSDVPALLVWAPTEGITGDVPGAGPPLPPHVNLLVRGATAGRALILVLDRDFVVSTMMPELVDRHFPAAMKIEIVDAKGTTVFRRALAEGQHLSVEAADLTKAFFQPRLTTGSPDDLRLMTWTSERLPAPPRTGVAVRIERRDSTVVGGFRFTPEHWQLRAQHAAGSLDRAVEEARRRNLYLSFGVLALLAGAVALVASNARRAQRLAAQQMEFVATVSHELRTPLAVIRSAAENITAGIVQDPAHARRYGDLIEREGRRLSDMVEHVLVRAGIDGAAKPLPLADVDVTRVVDVARDAVLPMAAAAGCAVEVTLEPGLGPVRANEVGLRGALENLLTNAIKHAASGRWVGITARAVSTGERPVVEIAVTDRGRGIDAADRARLFEPFYRGRRAVQDQIQGSGLGLSVVKQSVERMGGTVHVESAPGGGARFVIALPSAVVEA